MVYLFLGPSGCGKGTQASLLAEKLEGLPVISAGDACRWAYEQKLPEGIEAHEKYAVKGNLVADKLMISILKSYLVQFDLSTGLIFDSFPRKPSQVSMFDALLQELGEELKAVIHLGTSEKTALDRLQGRVEEDKKKSGAREDETPEAIKKRFQYYYDEVVPLLSVYRERGLLVNIDNSGTIDQVHNLIVSTLREKGLL